MKLKTVTFALTTFFPAEPDMKVFNSILALFELRFGKLIESKRSHPSETDQLPCFDYILLVPESGGKAEEVDKWLAGIRASVEKGLKHGKVKNY